MNLPNAQTHVPVIVELPEEVSAPEREYIHPPSLWNVGTKCKHIHTGEEAVVVRIDLGTMQFRPFYPATQTFSPKTEWQPCALWTPEVTLSANEVERREAMSRLEAEMAALDEVEMAAVSVLVDGDDPKKGLAKLEALRALGIIKGKPATFAAAIEDAKAPKRSGK